MSFDLMKLYTNAESRQLCTNYTAAVGSNHCFQAIGTYMNYLHYSHCAMLKSFANVLHS